MRHLLALLLFVPSLCLAQLPDYVPTEGLVAWYSLDGNATDLSGNQLDGTVNGPSLTDDRFGLQGAAYFDGVNDYIIVPHDDLLGFSNNSMTVSMWVRINALPTGTKEFQTLMKVNGWSHSTVGYQAVISWNGITTLRAKNGSTSSWMETWTIPSWDLGTYTHIAYSLTDTLCSSYINGELASSGVPTNTIIGTNQEPLILGWNNPLANTGASVAFSGDMDDVGFWNRALTAEEVQTLFLNSEQITGCTDSLACNYDPLANSDDGSCVLCEVLASACGEGTVWDSNTSTCIVANPTDTDLDGCTGVGDVLEVLSTFGQCYTAADTTWACGDPMNYHSYDYATVQIGNQCWFAANLHSTLYSDGTEIPEVTDGLTWADLGTGAWCSYNNSISNSESYGLLYNWHTVNSVSGLCPSDWHVPSDAEWITLEIQLGMPEDEAIEIGIRGNQGFHMKSTSGWNSNGNGSNSSGFSGLPGGDRYNNGSFANIGDGGYWWTSTASAESEFAFYRNLSPFNNGVSRFDYYQTGGFSVRCIKD